MSPDRAHEAVGARGTESLQTPRWREMDSNFQFRERSHVELGHHREVVDDMLRQARCLKLFAPLGSRCIAIADRPAERRAEDARTGASAQLITVIDGKTLW